jgi:hypothetical protein
MPRQYTQRAFIGGNIAKTDDINEELSVAAAESNGQLDQNNMPLNSVTAARMVEPKPQVEVDNTAVARFFVAHTYMPSQSYHVSEYNDADPTNLTFSSTTYDPADWRLGWMKLSEKRTTPIGGTNYYAGAEVTFDAQEGMIVGEVLVDLEWRASWRDIRYQLTPPPNEELKTITVLTQDNYIELGVFVNDVCCARTDVQWLGGRFTYVLPYSTPIGTTTAVVDIRMRLFFSNKFVTLTLGTVVDSAIAPVKVYDSSIWARNQYR